MEQALGLEVNAFSENQRAKTTRCLRVDVYKNRTRVGHSSKIDFAQILSRCSLLCL